MTKISNDPVYGWAMNFTTSSQPYVTQTNIIGGPSTPFVKRKLHHDCHIVQTDGVNSDSAPFYQLGPQPHNICPYYNYILPDAYPYGDFKTSPEPNPLLYWYFPYYRDTTFWRSPLSRVPKPG